MKSAGDLPGPGPGSAIEPAVQELRSLRDCVRWGVSRFREAGLCFGHGTDNPWDEALALALHAAHLDHDMDAAWLDCRLTAAERRAVCGLLMARVETRKPAAYLTGEAWFAGLRFHVDERVLVPRSPIAELIEARFEPWVPAGGPATVLDLCTGSGCIAVACAAWLPAAAVTAVDLSPDALEVARINVGAHGLEDRVELLRSDLYAALAGRRFDLIVSNPPYVPRARMAELPAEFRHEPAMALEAGPEGLDLVEGILAQAAEHLNPGGVLIVEVGEVEEAVKARWPELPFLWLQFERGGGGVFLLTAEQLVAWGGGAGVNRPPGRPAPD